MKTRYYKLDQDYKDVLNLKYKEAENAPEGYVTYAELIELSTKPVDAPKPVEAPKPKKASKKATKKSTKK